MSTERPVGYITEPVPDIYPLANRPGRKWRARAPDIADAVLFLASENAG
jgi:hypothetical protein